MKNQNGSSSAGIIMGTLLGAVLGVAATLYFAPKTSKKIKEDLKSLYDDACDKTCEIASSLKEKTANLIESAGLPDESEILEYAENNSSLLVGAIGGAVLGIAAALFSNKDSDGEDSEEMQEKYEKVKDWVSSFSKDTENNWSEKAQEVIGSLSDSYKNVKQKGKKSLNKKIGELLEWVTLGLNAFEGLKKSK